MASASREEEFRGTVAADVDGGVGDVRVVALAAEGRIEAIKEGRFHGVLFRVERVLPVKRRSLCSRTCRGEQFRKGACSSGAVEEDCLFGKYEEELKRCIYVMTV